jgi:hypothetical protein
MKVYLTKMTYNSANPKCDWRYSDGLYRTADSNCERQIYAKIDNKSFCKEHFVVLLTANHQLHFMEEVPDAN